MSMSYAICHACGRIYAAAVTAGRAFCDQCQAWLKSGQQLVRTTFEERVRLKTVRFKVAMGQTTDFPGEVSLPDRRVPGAAWYEARAILAEAFAELALPDEGEFA